MPPAQRRRAGARAGADLAARCGKNGRIEMLRRLLTRGYAVETLDPGIALRPPVRFVHVALVQRQPDMPLLSLDIA